MVNPKYDLSHLHQDLQNFLRYTHISHQSYNVIPLAFVQNCLNNFVHILIVEEMIDNVFQQYVHPNGQVYNISNGHHLKLYCGALYCRYCFTLHANVMNKCTTWDPNNPNASIPRNWTEDQFLD